MKERYINETVFRLRITFLSTILHKASSVAKVSVTHCRMDGTIVPKNNKMSMKPNNNDGNNRENDEGLWAILTLTLFNYCR